MAERTIRLQTSRPLGRGEIAELEAAGCFLDRAAGLNTYLVRSSANSAMEKVLTLNFVEKAEACGNHEKLDRTLATIVQGLTTRATLKGANSDLTQEDKAADTINVVVAIDPTDASSLEKIGNLAKVVESTDRRALLEISPYKLRDLADLDVVRSVEPVPEVYTSNNVARLLTGVESTADHFGLDGAGEIVGIADSGIDKGLLGDMLADLDGRVIKIRATAGKTAAFQGIAAGADLNNHGTHVAGSVAGDGTSSNGNVRGMAPAAQVTFTSMGQDETAGLTTPLDIAAGLLQDAYDDGARIHSNSWGDPKQLGRYTNQSDSVDQFVWDNRDMLVVIAAGNEGNGASTVIPPGTAKNCLTVGASESVRPVPSLLTLNPNFQDTDGDPTTPPINAILELRGKDQEADDPDDVAWFSSRGPVNDGAATYIKPDLVAPGTMILSTRSRVSVADLGPDGWPDDPQFFSYTDADGNLTHDEAVGLGLPGEPFFGTWNQSTPGLPAGSGAGASENYYYSDGTSMATPITSGTAALLRQYLRTQRGMANPSAALMKALLINGGSVPRGRATTANSTNGFGWLDLATTIAPDGSGQQIYADDIDLAVGTGEVRSFSAVVADSSVPLRATLVWTDRPGKGLQNKLYLRAIAPDGSIVDGDLTAFPVSTNNVQRVHIDGPMPGTYTLEVHGIDVPFGIPDLAPDLRQDFALAIMNGVGFSPKPVDVVQVIDRSGSMGFYGFLEPAKLRSSQLVDALRVGDRTGVVQFSTRADSVVPLTELAGRGDQIAIQSAIGTLTPGGNTSIGAGLQLGVAELGPDVGRPQSIVLLSDGYENTPPWVGGSVADSPPANYGGSDLTEVLPAVPSATKIYTLSLGTASDEELLQEMALARDGQFHSVYSSADQAKLHEIYVHLQALAGGEEVLASGSAIAMSSGGLAANSAAAFSAENSVNHRGLRVAASPPAGTKARPSGVPEWLRELLDLETPQTNEDAHCGRHFVEVDESIESATFTVSWHDRSSPVRLAVRTPGLRKLDVNDAGVWVIEGENHIMIRVNSPKPGTWCMNVSAAEDRDDGLGSPYSWGAHATTSVGLITQGPRTPLGRSEHTVVAEFVDPDDLAVRPRFSGSVSVPLAPLEKLAFEWRSELDRLQLPDEPLPEGLDEARLKLGVLDLVKRSMGDPSIFESEISPLTFSGRGTKKAKIETPIQGISTVVVEVRAESRQGHKVVRKARFDILS